MSQQSAEDGEERIAGSLGNWPQLNEVSSFSISDIKKLTHGFSKKNLISGGFTGEVYKATLPSAQIVAIKRTKTGYRKGSPEFVREINTLSGVHHTNLVQLVGVCFEKGEQIIISEFVQNGNLYDTLQKKTGIHLSWINRLRIALETARGLARLHESAEPPIVHGDVKSSNILLDASLRPKISDAGLWRLVKQSWGISLYFGSEGYLDPEWRDRELTDKSDVYSFGLVMLELLTGRKLVSMRHGLLRSTVCKAITESSRKVEQIVDPLINAEIIPGSERFVNLALRCSEGRSVDRPAMRDVVKELESIFEDNNLDSSDPAKLAQNPFEKWEMDACTAPHFTQVSSFSLADIRNCTADFSPENKIGLGGYGEGKLPTGQAVAVKRAKKDSMQGAREFKAEIELLSRVHHVNLVRLVGFCYERGEQILVYEFVPNGTLADSLSGKNEILLHWKDRLRIASGLASGLAYLHESADPPIMHRDVKPSNILLDKIYTPKLADFGISTLAEKEWATNVRGTYLMLGYLDPVCVGDNKLTVKVDVYSFGVVVLELVTGRKLIEKKQHITTMLKEAFEISNDVRELVDPIIRDESNIFYAERLIDLALRCVERDTAKRPSMKEAVREIEAILENDSSGASASSSQLPKFQYGEERASSIPGILRYLWAK